MKLQPFVYNNLMKVQIKDFPKIKQDNPNKKIVFLAGTFDLIHVGHIAYLNKAAEFGDILIVGVYTDSRTKHIKGHDRPVITQAQRATMVAHLKWLIILL